MANEDPKYREVVDAFLRLQANKQYLDKATRLIVEIIEAKLVED